MHAHSLTFSCRACTVRTDWLRNVIINRHQFLCLASEVNRQLGLVLHQVLLQLLQVLANDTPQQQIYTLHKQLTNVRWLTPLAAVLCGLLTIEHDWSRDHATSSVTAVLPPPDQHCGTVCLNSFGNRTSPLDSSNDRWKPLYLVSWATATCVWTLMAPTSNLLTYLLYKNVNESTSTPQTKLNQHKKY